MKAHHLMPLKEAVSLLLQNIPFIGIINTKADCCCEFKDNHQSKEM